MTKPARTVALSLGMWHYYSQGLAGPEGKRVLACLQLAGLRHCMLSFTTALPLGKKCIYGT